MRRPSTGLRAEDSPHAWFCSRRSWPIAINREETTLRQRSCRLWGRVGTIAHSIPRADRGAMSTHQPDNDADLGGRTLPKMMAIAMVLLAMVGAAVTLADATWARTYWLTLVPIFGVMCTIAAWDDARALDRMVVRQILH